jgi:hypothetical protein
MRRLARIVLAASMAFVFAAPTYASPPPAVAPILSAVEAGSVRSIDVEAHALPSSGAPSAALIPSPDPRPMMAYPTDPPAPSSPPLSRLDVAHAWTLTTLGPEQSACLWAIADWESHTQPYVVNASSGAYGLWQIKPVQKLIDWAAANGIAEWWLPLAQAQWASEYAVTRYGGACAATWAHSRLGYW